MTSTDLTLAALPDLLLPTSNSYSWPWSHLFMSALLGELHSLTSQPAYTHQHGVVLSGFTFVFPKTPPLPHCLPHNCTADAFAPTGALFWTDHLGIFRFWNLRAPPCDWLWRAHDNLGRNRSCVLLPSVSLEGSWGGFGGLGDHLTFKITGKQRNGEKSTNIHIFYSLHGFTSAWMSHRCHANSLLPSGSRKTKLIEE